MNEKTKKLAYTAMFAVICFAAFTYGKITIPLAAGASTAIHTANAAVVLSSWFLGPVYGGLAGAVGLSIADVIDPRYITSAPKTFLLKFMIGMIAGKMAEKMKLSHQDDHKKIIRITAISSAAGLGANVVLEPIIGYFYRKLVLRMPTEAASIIAAWSAGVTAFNAVICVFISVMLYLALYRAFRSRFSSLH